MGEFETSSESYVGALDWLFGLRRLEPKRDLRKVVFLLELLGNPQESFKSIQVTGTNGKGSTTAMITSILGAAGYRVGMFTSPHLTSFTERIVVNGNRISEGDVIRLCGILKPLVDRMACEPDVGQPPFFDVVTCMALKYFAEHKADFAVLEAGMGGRLDATNVVHSLVSVITNVSLEHTEVLGGTVLEIAREKSGIVKKGGVLITATDNIIVYELFKEICHSVGSKIFRVGDDIRYRKFSASMSGQSFSLDGLVNDYDELFIPLIGDHQLKNASSTVGAVEALSFHGIEIKKESIRAGLRRVIWPGRLEIVQSDPLIVLDCAKDPDASRALKESLMKDFKYERLIAVVSISSDKDIPSMMEQLAQVADYFVITAHRVMGRAADPLVIANEAVRWSRPFEIAEGVEDAIDRALTLAHANDLICVTGSVFLVGEARGLFKPLEKKSFN